MDFPLPAHGPEYRPLRTHLSHRFGGTDRCLSCDARWGGVVATWPCGAVEARARLPHGLACPDCVAALNAAVAVSALNPSLPEVAVRVTRCEAVYVPGSDPGYAARVYEAGGFRVYQGAGR